MRRSNKLMLAWERLIKLSLKPVPMRRVVLVVALIVATCALLFRQGMRTTLADDQSLEVRDLIRKVKSELAAAELDMYRNNEPALFKLQDLEMEVHFVVRSSGGARAEVVGVGADADISNEKVQKLKLRWIVKPETVVSTVPPSPVKGNPDVTIDAQPPQ